MSEALTEAQAAIEVEARKLCEAAGYNCDVLVFRSQPYQVGAVNGIVWVAPKPEEVFPMWVCFHSMAVALRESARSADPT